MDTSRFGPESPGSLVRITNPDDYAFVPNPLPPEGWQLPRRLFSLLTEARALLGELNGIGHALPNPELLLKPLQGREAITSSRLEGTYATPEQLLLFEMDQEDDAGSEEPSPWREVSNYRQALREGSNYLRDAPNSLALIRELHSWLMQGVRGHEANPGAFRSRQVYIGVGRRFVPPPVELMNDCLQELEATIRRGPGSFDPLVFCYFVHYQFETIHPFGDGNGRVGRLLLALMTWQLCGLSMPWLYMSAFFEKFKDDYIDRLFGVSLSNEWDEWLEFCLVGTKEQAADSLRRCTKLIAIKQEMQDQAVTGSGRLHTIVEGLFHSPMTTVPRVSRHFDVTYPTARADIDKLVDLGILRKLEGPRRPMVFYSPQIFDIAFGELGDG